MTEIEEVAERLWLVTPDLPKTFHELLTLVEGLMEGETRTVTEAVAEVLFEKVRRSPNAV